MPRTVLLSGALVGVAALLSARGVRSADLLAWEMPVGAGLEVSLVVTDLFSMVPADLGQSSATAASNAVVGGVGAEEYRGVKGQGVSGLKASLGYRVDWPAQLYT